MPKIFKHGAVAVTIPAAQQIAIISDSPVKVYQFAGYPNVPSSWSLLATTTAGASYLSGAFAAGAILRLEAGASDGVYEVGATPSVYEVQVMRAQGAPHAETTAATLTIAEILNGIITGTHAAGATQAYVLPTGTLTDAGVDMEIGEAFDWVLINLSAAAADTITVTAGVDHTLVGSGIVASAHATTGGAYGNGAIFRTRKTAANTFVTYRIA